MSDTSYPMTRHPAIHSALTIKERALDLFNSVEVKQRGGLYFWKVGSLGGTFHLKRKPPTFVTRAPNRVEPDAITVKVSADRMRFIR